MLRVNGRTKFLLAVFPAESVTVTGKVEVAALDGGVPLSWPASLRVSQPGSPVPDQKYLMPAPPDAVRLTMYATPTEAAGKGLTVVMLTPAPTGRVTANDALAPAVSVAVTVKLAVTPLDGGVPVSTPAELRVSQGGR